MLTRLMSGFISSIESGIWQPTGTPAIYRMIDRLDASEFDLDVLFTLKAMEGIDKKYLDRPLSLQGLSVTPKILSGPNQFPRFFAALRTYLSECKQSWFVYRYVKKTRPDFVYIDRANVLLGAIIARFTNVPVHLRLLGAPPSLEVLMTKRALSHYLYRWAYRSPFRMVLCSRDGSPGKSWMSDALHPYTPRKRWINGVDPITFTREHSVSAANIPRLATGCLKKEISPACTLWGTGVGDRAPGFPKGRAQAPLGSPSARVSTLWGTGCAGEILSVKKLGPLGPSFLFRIVLIGRLNALKRIDQAILAILNLPTTLIQKIHVDIIGDGEQYASIEKVIQYSHYSKQFTMHGAIPHQDVLKKLSQSDIFISLNTHGNLTNTVLEAIRCGLCLILPEADEHSAIDQDTYTVIPSDSVLRLRQAHLLDDLTEQLQYLIQNPKRLHSYQEKIQDLSKNIDTWDQRIEKEVQLLKSYDFVIVISDLRGGGTQKVLERLLEQWVKKGKHIAIITLDIARNDVIRLPDKVDRIAIGGISESSNVFLGLLQNLKRIQRIRRVIKRLDPPLVISFLSAMNVLTTLATRRLNCRLIISERNDPARQSFGRIWDYLRKKYYCYADVVTANSYSALRSLMGFVQKEKCYYVPNPLMLPNKIPPISLKNPTILAVGRLHIQKSYDVLINAFSLFNKQYPNWQLIILGEGPLRGSLEQQIEELHLSDVVQLKGYVDPFPYFVSAQIFTMPSRYEGMPNALLEALAMGMPAVISDALTGPLDFIHDKKNALVVPVEDSQALSQAFSTLADDSVLRDSIAIAGKQTIAPFLMDAVLPKWDVLFHA